MPTLNHNLPVLEIPFMGSRPYLMDIAEVWGAQPIALNAMLCAYGKTTDSRKCGNLVQKNVSIREKNTGIVNNVFIARTTDGSQFVKEGDSGGPVFADKTAYGLIKGYRDGVLNEMLFVDVTDTLAAGGLGGDVWVKKSP